MKTKKYIEFRDNYLDYYDNIFFKNVGEYIKTQGEKIKSTLRKQLEQVVGNVSVLQEQIPIEAGCIQISLLISSIDSDIPELMYEVYDSDKEFGRIIYTQTFGWDWIKQYWDTEKRQLENKIKELKQQAYLGTAAIEALMYEKVDSIIQLMAFSLKYDFGDFGSFRCVDKLLMADKFYLSIGEYRGWQKKLYCHVPEQDIFKERLEKEFSYMRFDECAYKEKRFVGLKLDCTRFCDCVFVDSVFKKVDFRDAQFINCVFRNCVFEQCSLNGCVFEQCDMQRIEWNENQMKNGAIEEDNRIMDICRPTTFLECVMHKHTFKANIIRNYLKLSCDEADIVEVDNEIL